MSRNYFPKELVVRDHSILVYRIGDDATHPRSPVVAAAKAHARLPLESRKKPYLFFGSSLQNSSRIGQMVSLLMNYISRHGVSLNAASWRKRVPQRQRPQRRNGR